MILDHQLIMSKAQAITGSTAAQDSTNTVDLGKPKALDGDLFFFVRVDTTCTTASGDATLTVALKTSDDGSTWTDLFTTGAVAKANLLAGAVLARPNLKGLPLKRYVKAVYTVGTTALNAGKVDALLTSDLPLR